MARRKAITPVESVQTKFSRVYEMEYGNFTIEKGDLIKIQGEYGTRFKFLSITTNTETGAFWVDCIETYRGQSGPYRSFAVDRVRRIPKKRTRKAKAKTND
jgi:hypothetical protein